MRKKSVSEIMLALLLIGMLAVVFNVRLAAAQGPFIRDLQVLISPGFPTTYDEVYVTVSFYILEAYHFVDFGPLKRVDNTFSVDINVSAVGLDIYGPFLYKQRYTLGKLSQGSYWFNAFVYVDLSGILVLLASATNSFTVTPAGDMDGDGYVGPIDLDMFASAYGKREGQLGYDPVADLDRDRYIGSIDLSVFAANYAQPHKIVDSTCQLQETNKTFTVTVGINLADGMDQNEAIEVATKVFEKEFEASIGYIAHKPTSANVDEKGIWTVEFSWGYKNEGLGHWFRAVINPFDQTILYDRCK